MMSEAEQGAQTPIWGQESSTAYLVARNTAWVSGAFSLLVAVVLLGHLGWRMTKDPFDSLEFQVLKVRLLQRPTDAQLQGELRRLDQELRWRYFWHRRFAAFGALLLLCGVAVTVASATWAGSLRRRLPQPGPYLGPSDQQQSEREWARMAVVGMLGAVFGAALVAGLAFPSLLPRQEDLVAQTPGPSESAPIQSVPPMPPAPSSPPSAKAPPSTLSSGSISSEKSSPEKSTKEKGKEKLSGEALIPEGPDPQADRTAEFATLEEWQRYWPRFRGPDGSGICRHSGAPTHWNAMTGEGICWKVAVPLPGHNSPIVWKDRVFLSGADAQRREVYCFDAATGKLLWARGLPPTAEGSQKVPKVARETGFAAPTMTTDGRRVFAIFANGDLAAFDMEGRLVWIRGLGIPENHYGHAASLETWQNLLFVQLDQGMAHEKKSRLLALDTLSGQTVWQRQRDVAVSWASPLLIRRDQDPLLITAADPWVIAYRPQDGQEIWRIKCLSGEHGVSPAYGNGLVHVGNEYCQWFALRTDGKGDVTSTHIAWKGEEGLPDVCSPLVTEKYLFLLMTYGTLTCYHVHTGKVLWTKDFDQVQFMASPSWADGRVYLLGQFDIDQKDAEGNPLQHTKAWVLEPTDSGAKEVGQGLLDEGCVASPAFQPGRIYIRGKQHLFCIGS
ncbi:MAG: PQQ-like beta-propeller repeat protein [Thermoguttaceae bacterium]|nr:PQQ-like beta-propeller repeat protein [Thermoguttaceae bacterium]MDW8038723.1 PQQ-binding-like beta-propeller repeat protein [Thermoguttaceae bacterium]